MDYNLILNDIKPTDEEDLKVNGVSLKLMKYLEKCISAENIDACVFLVGSVSKGTYLRGKSDIDIFIAFPLDTDKQFLKENGLKLAHMCCDHFGGVAEHHFASHPYVTCDIEGFEVDIVPCYAIKDGSEVKSAVDRTILHTQYVKANLKDSQKDEVLLLKRFMDMTGTYGSEFKVGGFAGYLCELLIIKYGSFENTLKHAQHWQFGHVIDLEEYGTAKLFKDPLIVVDPTDKNRNVGAALRLDKMGEFIQSARNYLNSNNKKDYFYPLKRNLNKELILTEFENRGSDLIAIKFDIPEIPLDTLHPQIRKTTEALERKLNDEEFNVFRADYWTDESEYGVILLEMASSTLNNVKINVGPKVFINKACNNFANKYGAENCYILGDYLVSNRKREFTKAEDYIAHILTKDHINLIKAGKNLRKIIVESYEFVEIEELECLEFLDDFLNPGQHISR